MTEAQKGKKTEGKDEAVEERCRFSQYWGWPEWACSIYLHLDFVESVWSLLEKVTASTRGLQHWAFFESSR